MKQPPTQAELAFMVWSDLYERERPFQLFYDVPEDAVDQRKTNIEFQHHAVGVHNARGQEAQFGFDTNGFKIVTANVQETLHSAEDVESKYLPELRKVLEAEVEDVDRIVFFDWRLRSSTESPAQTHVDLRNGFELLKPADVAHLDQSGIAVVNRVRSLYGDEAEELLQRRIRVINIWKPLENAVYDWPLAVADGSTVDSAKLVDTDVVRPQYVGSNRYVLHQPQLRWYYVKEQRPNEVLLFKQFDTRTDIPAQCCPHGAFKDAHADPSRPGRKSIEVRALVIGKAQ